MNLKSKVIKFLLFLSFLIPSLAFSIDFKLKLKDEEYIKRYLKLHQTYSKKLCSPGTEPKYWKYFYAFRGEGYYLPVLLNGSLDKDTINRFLPELIRKRQWIEDKITSVEKIKDFQDQLLTIKNLLPMIDQLLKYKEILDDSSNPEEIKKTKNRMKYLFIDYKTNMLALFDKVDFSCRFG